MKSIIVLIAAFLIYPTELVRGQQPSPPQITDEFQVLAYPAPPPEESNVARYREIANAGFNAVVPGMGAWDRETHLRVLELAKMAGLRVLVTDLRILPWHEEDRKRIDQSQIDSVTADYRHHPALLGYFICDEPNASYFAELASTSQRIHLADPEHSAYINLFPGYASAEQLGCNNFREYVQSYLQTVKPRVLSYDHYPLLASGRDDTGWYDDLRVIREESRQAEIPFWICLQSEGIKGILRIPTRSEVFWQISAVLAYGARGVTWFTYWTPPPSQDIPADSAGGKYMPEQHVGGIISRTGQRTPLYEAVREANRFLRKAGNELTGWDNRYIAHFLNGSLQEGDQSPCITPVGTNAKLVVGTFSQDDRRRVVIANDSYTEDTSFRIKPVGIWQPSAVIATLEANQKSSDNDFSDWELGPGGCLVLECKQSATADR